MNGIPYTENAHSNLFLRQTKKLYKAVVNFNKMIFNQFQKQQKNYAKLSVFLWRYNILRLRFIQIKSKKTKVTFKYELRTLDVLIYTIMIIDNIYA